MDELGRSTITKPHDIGGLFVRDDIRDCSTLSVMISK